MGELYQDKTEDKIKQDVSEQFKKDDTIVRDDYEIYASAKKVIDSYVKEITSSNEIFGPRALQEFSKLDKELSKEMSQMKGRKYLTENKKIINDIANRIDDAEKKILERLILNRSNAKTINAINASEQNKKYFTRESSGVLNLTSAVNKPSIHEVLGNVFKNNTDIYKIDYSGCTNQNIKNKMSSLTGNGICYIEYDQIKKTYLLTDAAGNKLEQRALIREGVKLTPGGVIAYKGKQEKRKNIDEKNKQFDEQSNISDRSIDDLKKDSKRGSIIKLIPSSLKAELEKDVNLYKYFLSKTDKRLDEIIIDAKSKNRELHTEPISKVGAHRDGLMEVHMIVGTAEKDVVLWNDKNHLGNGILYDILDGEESGYKSYLTSRIQQKRSEYDYLTKQESVVTKNKEVKQEDLASVAEKTNAMYGLGLMGKLVTNIREETGNTRANSNDRKIIDMAKYIRNAQYTIQTNENVSKSDLQNISSKLKDLFWDYIPDKSNGLLSTRYIETYCKELIFGPKDKSIEAVRKMGEGLTNFDNTHTTFLRDEIIENDNLEIKESIYNNCFQKIGEILAIPEGDGVIPENIKTNIDNLYAASANSQSVLDFLKSKGMLPSFVSLDDEKIKEGCDKIYNTIQNKNQIINNFNITPENMKGSLQEEKINLESKDNKTSDDIARLNAILFLLENPEALEEQAKNQTKVMKDVTKYAGIDSEIKGAIGSRLIKQGGGVSGTNADIYNDSIGAGGWFERSDENVAKTSEILEQIAIEVAICIVAIAAGALTAGVGTAAIYGARAAMIAARVVSVASKGGKIFKIMKLSSRFANYKKYYKLGKMTAQSVKKGIDITRKANALQKTTKLGRFVARNNPFTYAPELGRGLQRVAAGTALTLEGTTFHLSSTVLHNAVAGKMDLFEGTDPTGYMVLPDGTEMPNRKSYAQSIAFLGVLKAVGQPVQEITKAGLAKIMSEKATASMMGKAVQSMGSFSGEVGTLMGTEQVLSLTFDQKLSPLTWDGFIHTIGMVAGLRGYNMLKQKGQLKVKDYKQSSDGKSIELLTLEVTRDGKTYETFLNSKGEVVRTTDPMLRQGMEVKVEKYGARSEILNRAPANRNNTADYIAKNRYENGNNKTNEGIPTEVQIRTGEKVKIDHDGKYKDIINQYKDLIKRNKENPNLDITTELSKLDMQLAERITLDKGRSIEYASAGEAMFALMKLDGMKQYEGILRKYKNFEGKRCIEKLSSNTIMPNIYISIKGMEGRRGVDYTGATIKNFEIPINNLQTGDQIFTEFGSKRYEFAKKENGNWEVISEGGRFEKGNEVKLIKNKDGTMTFERIGDARKMEVSEIGLKKFASSQSEVIIKDVIDSKQIENLVENFDAQIMSDKGITIDGKNYKMMYEPNMIQNKEGIWKLIVAGEVFSAKSENGKVLPDSSEGNIIREKYYELRDKYVSTEVAKSGKEVKIEIETNPELKVESKPAEVKKSEPVQQPESGTLEKQTKKEISKFDDQIKLLETQRAEMEKQYKSKKDKTPDDITAFNQNMDAFNQKIEALKVEKAKLVEPVPQNQANPEVSSQKKIEQISGEILNQTAKTDIDQVDIATSTNKTLSSSPEGLVVKTKIKGLTERIKEFFRKPTESEVQSIEQETVKTEKSILENKNLSTKITTEAKILLQKIKDIFARRKQRWTREKTNTTVTEPKTMEELIVNVETTKGVEAYKQGKLETNGTVSPSGDKEFLKSPEIVQALKDGNFEEFNFQKGDEMLALRNKGVELYIKEKIMSVDDMINFVFKNKNLFGGGIRQAKLLEELKKPKRKENELQNITEQRNLREFNKKVQSYQEISGPKSKSGFDMKSIVDNKVKELISDIITKEKKSVIEKEVKIESTIETSTVVEKTKFDLRKMSPDTQQVVEKLKAKYPKLEPLFKSMVVKDYDSEIVQKHLDDLNLLPKELIDQIKEKDIVFFISNEGVTSWVWNADLKGTIPRGWEETGLKRDDVAGMANREGGVHAGKGEHGSVSLVLHELGHQIDIKGIVDTKEISPFYELFKTEKKITDDYLLQEGEAGLQEFTAESFAEFYKLPKSEFVAKYNEEYYQKLQKGLAQDHTNTQNTVELNDGVSLQQKITILEKSGINVVSGEKEINVSSENIEDILDAQGNGNKLAVSDIQLMSPEMINTITSKIGRNNTILRSIINHGKILAEIQEYNSMIKTELGTVADVIGQIIEKSNKVSTIDESMVQKTIDEIYPKIKNMDGNVQIQVIATINQYMNKIIAIEKNLNTPKYKNNAKQLLSDMRGFENTIIQGDVAVERNGMNLVFYVKEPLDYLKVIQGDNAVFYNSVNNTYVNTATGKPMALSGGAYTESSHIPGLDKTLTIVNGAKGSNAHIDNLRQHEGRHGINSLIINHLEKTNVKNELIAYMAEPRGKDAERDILDILIDENGLYTYGMKEESPEWNRHTQEVKRAVQIAFQLKYEVPNYLELLAITPMGKRNDLLKSPGVKQRERLIGYHERRKKHNG